MAQGSLETARAAHAAYDWRSALLLLKEARAGGPVGVDDLERLAEAAMWLGEFEVCATAREEAFAARMADGESQRAAALALDLCMDNICRQRISIAVAWAERAQRLVADEPPCLERARLEDLLGLAAASLEHDLDAALSHFRAAADLGRQIGHAGIQALASTHIAVVMTRTGKVAAGLRLMDSAMTAAVAGELDPVSTARVYCAAISLCQTVGDVRRAREWGAEATRCSARPGLSDFPGDCRLHRAEMTRLAGDWDGAQTEVERAIPELERWDIGHVAEAWYDLGEIRRLRGDFDAAADAYQRAESLGRAPQPGLARLQLARGEESMARAMLVAGLQSAFADPPLEAQLLAAVVEAHLVCGDRQAAAQAAGRLTELAGLFGTVVLQASAAMAESLVSEPPIAVAAGRRAVSLWRDAEAPYETALAQFAVADASRRNGDPAIARIELDAALATFRALGARWDAERTEAALARLDDATPARRVERTFLFTDLVGSTSLLAAMGDDAWATVLRWHDRTIRELLDSHRGTEVKQRGGGDGFFAVFADAKAGIDCAIAIQATFARHRDEHGFTPAIRIGVHEAAGLQHAGDYSGRGVHEAARIAELAGAEEITATASTARSAGATAREASHEQQLRGLPGYYEVVYIEWDAGA